ncbi:hypothetical protein GOP47_0002993 [Adiantum capillus-veneris]|uniref:Uncharacterized protein n=1 Tax=Adiantum capillus-veneris TaxID=13818 RepID=A0A9D4VB53_ADICA|nr:hypothetical protein GOP47_0002993 [Adiantum capillus-veneris]
MIKVKNGMRERPLLPHPEKRYSCNIEITAAKIELDWPKFLISLSRKEKEHDFFMIKGTKLPQSPKRRHKVVERALHFCTPGSCLTDLSRGRDDVREKKCVKKTTTSLAEE